MHPRESGANRRRLRLLDACLSVLELAHEQGQVLVPEPVAAKLRPHVAAIVPGMPITEAIEQVLRCQERYLRSHLSNGDRVAAARSRRPAADPPAPPAVPDPPAVPEPPAAPIDVAGARELTNLIRVATCHVCLLLMEAHQRRVWLALGYRTWEEYIHSEFGLSRSRSYELLDQARVIQAIRHVTRMSGIPDISAYAAGQIKPRLAEVTETLRARTEGLPQESLPHVIHEVIKQKRASLAERRTVTSEHLQVSRSALRSLVDAIEHLAQMPPVPDTLEQISETEAYRLAKLDHALSWLATFSRAWAMRTTPADAQDHGGTGQNHGSAGHETEGPLFRPAR
jgi:hypothetical protein